MERLEPPSYRLASALFLRLVAACFLVAFVSLWAQVHGLVGARGILPVGPFLEGAREALGGDRYRLLPTLCWLDASDGALHVLCGGGAVVSLLALAGVAPALCLALAWVFYLSLSVAGQVFLEFQWDLLLLEVGFLGIFLVAPRLRPRAAWAVPPSPIALLLLRWLLFRLNFSSGLVKIASGDPSWRSLTALSHHYETQPLPTWTAWFMHQLPASFQTASALCLFAIELAVPFLIFGPRRARRAAGAALAALQIAIAATGNYAFFNLLSLTLCVLCFDDAAFPQRWRFAPPAPEARGWPRWVLLAVAGVVFLATSVHLLAFAGGAIPLPRVAIGFAQALAPFRTTNGYGLFAVMTTERPEIVIEGSEDGVEWKPYEFRWKPGDVRRRPRFVAPHQPRLDWQMWFAALSTCDQNPWLQLFLGRLLQGSPPVVRLLRVNPFPDRPPRFIRAQLYDYKFTDFATRRLTGAWWRREAKGLYCPVFSREMLRAP